MNSRTPCEVSGFQDRHVRPLRHPSGKFFIPRNHALAIEAVGIPFRHRLQLGWRWKTGGFVVVAQSIHMVSVVSLEQVRVDIQCNVDALVPELLLDIFRVGLSLNQETGKRVPEVMEPNLAVAAREARRALRTSSLLIRCRVGPRKIQSDGFWSVIPASRLRVSLSSLSVYE